MDWPSCEDANEYNPQVSATLNSKRNEKEREARISVEKEMLEEDRT